VATLHLGHLRRELRNTTPAAPLEGTGDTPAQSAGSADPAALPAALRPAPGTVNLSALIAAHTAERTVLAPELADAVAAVRESEPARKGRHRWRPGEPIEWRPAPRPTLRVKYKIWRVDA
jgi:hypothetical protein